MSERLLFEFPLDCGMLKARMSYIKVEVTDGKPRILEVTATIGMKAIDIKHMLTLETLEDMRRFVFDQLKYQQAADAVEPWDGPTDAA